MDTQALFSHGGEMVKNPNYSPNNGQPEYINNTDISKTNNGLASTFYKATEEGLNYSVTDQDLLRKSKKYGVPLTKEAIESGAIDKQFYDAQSRLSKIFNSIEQTLVGEIGLGTLKGFSEIADMIGNAITHIGPDKDNDRTFFEESALTKFIADLQEKNKQAFEINTDPNVHLGSGALGNLGWYANNLPSIASSITLLIPSRLITKAVPKLLSKGINVLNKTDKVAKESSNLVAFTMKGKKAINTLNKDKSLGIGSIGREVRKQRFENISDAALMRTMENYQEAKQANDEVFNIARDEFADNQKYADFINNNPQFVQELRDNDIDLSDKDEVARYIAKKSAKETFKLDYANIIFDLVQVAALKNPAKIGKNRKWKGRNVAQAQRRRIENPLESLDAVATKEKADNILKKTSNLFKDLSGMVPSLLAQASEGVEEAVNYIAQQQGITYGNVILNKEEPFAYSFLPRAYKLNEYIHNPEMWDAAFWGFAGGIAFEIGGSEFNARMNALNERREDKKKGITPSKFNDYVKKYKEDIYRINDISSSSIELNNLINQFALINNGQNPFRVDENGEYRTFVDNNEIENAKARVKKQTIDTLALNALQASNYDMLEAFLINPNVRKVLIDAGVMEEKDSQAFMDDVVSEMRNVAKIYNEELDQLDDWSSNIKEKVPIEYLQMVARKNTAIRLDNELLELDKNLYNTVVGNIITTMQEQRNQDPTSAPIPENINDLVRLRMYASRLAEVQAQLKTLKEDEDVRSSVDGSIAISRLNKEKTKLLNEIQLLKNVDAPAAAIWSLLHSELGTVDDNGKVKIANRTGDYLYYEKAIRDHDKKIVDKWLKNNGLESLGKNLDLEAFFTENKQGTYNLLADELGKLNKFLNDNPNLANKLNSAEYLSLMQLENNSTRINNSKELLEEINYINDSLKDAYTEAEKQARDKILEIADKLENGEQKVYQFLFNNEKINDISDEDLATLESAKNIMNFSKRSLGYIDKVKNDIQTQFRNKEIKKLQEEEESTTFEKPQDGTQPIQPIDTKPEDTKSSTGENNGISGSNNGQNGSQQMTKVHVTINADEVNKLQINQVIGDHEGDDIVELNNYAENQYELRVSQEENRAKNNVENLLKSTTLFNGYNEQQEKNKGVTRVITENPIFTIENINGQSIYKVIKKGTIVYNLNDSSSSSSTGEVKPTKNDTPDDDEILTTDAYKEITQVRNNLVDDNIQTYIKDGLSLNEIVKLVNKTIRNSYPNVTDETINAVFEDTKSYITSLLALNDENTNKELADAIAKLTGVALSSSTVDENVEMTQDAFEAVKEILPYYINRHDIPAYKSLNDNKPKYFINLEQLLTDINDIYNDKGIIGIVYNFVRDYLNTEEGKNKYVITDLNSDAPDFFEKLNKKIEEPTREPNTTIQTGDTSSLEAEDFEHLLKLEDDTEVIVTIEDYKKGKRTYKRLVLNHKDGDKTYRVGTLPLANYSNNGIYSMYIQGWAYELNDDNGHINSNVLDIFVELLKNKDIYNTLVQIRSKSTSNDERKELQKKLSDIIQNYEFNGKKLKDFIFEPEEEGEEKTEEYQEIKHLQALISYDLRKLSYEEAKDKIRDSVYNFIRKVYNSYSSAKHVQDRINDNQEVSLNVTKVPAGYFEEIVKEKSSPDDILSNHYDELELSNKGLQDLNTVRLGLKDRQIGKQGGDIRLDDGTTLESMPNIFAGDIIVSILNKNGIPFNTKAVSVRLGDKDLNNSKIKDEDKSTAYKVVKIIKNEINKRLDDWKETDEHFEDFVDFLKTLLYRNRTNDINEPLLQGIAFNDLRKTEGYIEIGIHNSVSIHISNSQIQISTKDPESDKWNFATYTKSGNYKLDALKKKFEQLLNNAYFNISFVTLKEFEPNNKTGEVTKGFITKDGTGKLVLKIPSIKDENEIITADDYKHFILEGGFVRVNVKKHNRTFNENGEKKVVDTGNFIFGNNSRIQIEVPDMIDISTPVKEDMIRVEPTKSSIQKAIESKRNNAFRTAFKLANLDRIKVQRNGKEHTVNVLNMLKKFGLYDNNITFEETLNTRDTQFNYTGPIANVNPSTGEITVGQRWLDMFNTKGKYANPKNRAVAIRKLIHETLHTKFHQDDNIKYVKQLQEVFDDFKKYVNEKEKSGEISKENAAKMKVYFFTDVESKVNDDITESQAKLNALEEFVVESFTNSELANFLNSITVEGYKVKDVKKKDRTLFQKILDFLAEIFNWNINDDTLYAKEYLLLADGITKLEEPITKEEQQNLDKQIEKIENKEQTEEFNSEEFKADRRSRRREAFKSTDRARDNIKESTREERFDSSDKGYNSEMQSIKDKAVADGTFMKAPNGKHTNLTEKQWLQVRTKAFKDWFGDWTKQFVVYQGRVSEKDGRKFNYYTISKEEASSYGTNVKSKIIDTTKMLSYFSDDAAKLREEFYKKTGKRFDILNNSKEGLQTQNEFFEFIQSKGYTGFEYLSEHPYLGNDFIENPYVVEFNNHKDSNSVSKVVDENGEPLVVYHGSKAVFNIFDSSKIGTSSGNYGVYGTGLYFNRYKNEAIGYGNTRAFFLNIRNPRNMDMSETLDDIEYDYQSKEDAENLTRMNIKLGYDGIFGQSTTTENDNSELLIYNPNQAKSATDNSGEFSRTNNNIYQSTRDEHFENVNDFVNSAKPRDKKLLLEGINNGEISNVCN